MTALQDEIRALREQVELLVVGNQGPPGLDPSWASALCPTPAVRSAPGFPPARPGRPYRLMSRRVVCPNRRMSPLGDPRRGEGVGRHDQHAYGGVVTPIRVDAGGFVHYGWVLEF